VLDALGLLANLNAGQAPDLKGGRVLVLGGGDTAMDCARSALRLGAASVIVAYRGPEARLRAAPSEVQAAREEGASFLFGHSPIALVGAGRIQGVRFATEDGEAQVHCDWVVPALGQVPAPPDWLADLGVKIDDTGRIRVDPEGRTSNPRVYAGGDASQGPDLVVTALAAGRRAAAAILADRAALARMRRVAPPRALEPQTAQGALA
jgi:glutamate synthase (NADPH/NADH) small chain